jgi:hypothetical protein
MLRSAPSPLLFSPKLFASTFFSLRFFFLVLPLAAWSFDLGYEWCQCWPTTPIACKGLELGGGEGGIEE